MKTNEPTTGLVNHLKELKRRLTYCLAVIGGLFCSMIYFANDLYLYLSKPILSALPYGSTMIATDVAAPLLAPLKFVFLFSIFLAIPFLLYQLWVFMMPGLYKNEKRFIWPLLLSSIFLFYLGTLFAYFVVFPIVFGFLVSMAPEGIAVMPDMSKYLTFAIKLFFAFGLSFEVPVAVFLLIRTNMVSVETLQAKRPYVFVMAFIVGMLLTPPDVISQIMLAIPIWLLFEVGLLVGARAQKKEIDKDDES